MKKILFFTQSLGRTGAEIALFNLISQQLHGYKFVVVTDTYGELIDMLPSGIKVIKLSPGKTHSRTLIYILTYKIRKKLLLWWIQRFTKADLWYINTILFSGVVRTAARRKIPFVVHVHELEQMYYYLSNTEIQDLINYPNLLIACSSLVADNMSILGRRNNMEVIHPLPHKGEPLERIDKKMVLSKHGIPSVSFIWMMAGTTDVNKNPLLFIEIAERVIKEKPDTAFVWQCHEAQDGYFHFCRKLIEHKNLSKNVFFIDAGDNYRDMLRTANGILLTSHKESFSLVTLEGHALGIPCVTTDCGGVNEIIVDGTGTIVKSNQPEDFAKVLLEYMSGNIMYDSEKAKERAKIFNHENTIAKWQQLIKTY